MWGALFDERTDLSFTIAAGPRQCRHFRVRLSWKSWPYFTVSDSRLPFSSPPTTRRVTVEVFDLICPFLKTCRHGSHRKHRTSVVAFLSIVAGTCLPSCCPETASARTTVNTVLILLRALYSNDRCLQSPISNGPVRHNINELLPDYTASNCSRHYS
jgi:hypothetical protein